MRDRRTQVSTTRGTQTSATRLARGDLDHVATVANATSSSASPGTPTTPATASPAASRVRSMPSSANRRGSRVSSMPTKTGTTRNASTATDPPPTTTAVETSVDAYRSAIRVTTSSSVMPAP